MAAGSENGRIYILGCERGGKDWRVVKEVEGMTHSDAVTGLTWRPGGRERVRELASCGDDCSVRIYEIEFDTITRQFVQINFCRRWLLLLLRDGT